MTYDEKVKSIKFLNECKDETWIQMRRGLVWKPFIKDFPKIRFVISSTRPFTITAVPTAHKGEYRQRFPETWHGLCGKKLQNLMCANIGRRVSTVMYCNHGGTQMIVNSLNDVASIMSYVMSGNSGIYNLINCHDSIVK